MQGLLDIDLEKSVLDGEDVLDHIEGLDDEFVSIYQKCVEFAALMLGEDEYRDVKKAFLGFANAVQGGNLESWDDLKEELWAGYHTIPILFSCLRWYGEDGKFHYNDADEAQHSAALKNNLESAQKFHALLPGDWVSVSETGGKGIFGKVLQLAEARYALDTGRELTVDQIVVLSGLNRRSVLNAVSKSDETGLAAEDGRISNAEAKRWLSARRTFKPTELYRPFGQPEARVAEAVSQEFEEDAAYEFVPVTDDNVAFLPDIRRAQGYQIGKYGQEEYVIDYFEALKKLQGMSTPRFRRPNAEGNWGIKVGVEWRRVPLVELRHALPKHEDE